ncbi:MAG: toll/interleukin-1 receptor domain-containing protein, partial [Dehalococcoidia bacterium]
MAANLFKNRIPVWVDKWELKVGDSIVKRIESAIENADALLVVLSRASVESEWCKKELTAGLIKELEEKSVFVMPIVIDNCVIPLFLRDKLYAD